MVTAKFNLDVTCELAGEKSVFFRLSLLNIQLFLKKNRDILIEKKVFYSDEFGKLIKRKIIYPNGFFPD